MATVIKPPKKPKPKKCKCCPTKFTPRNSLQTVCSPKCAIQLANQLSDRKQKRLEKAERAAWNKRKADVKPLSHWMKLAQQAFNEFIRTRDAEDLCISCGRMHDGQWHAGHFRTVKASPETRFDEDGCHKQCMPCNHHLSGNIPGYKPNLITKIGQEAFDRLIGPHELKKWTREELQELAAHYRQKTRELNKNREAA
ncbi:recombination endonuclease [Erwinia phage vB_EhrS_49]|uniref:Protein ninG n=2 Tax=Feofaniavirus TaxID=2733174 RepID=A0A4Y1NRK9_9CAUD|nr:NinG/ Rap DNA junction specific endonuclease [Erwinia phage vB_EhrS_49]YP_009824101.1 NinG/ Rap DNA junction specific endonuclease [Erwinia phage vB_EhrS_59]AXH43513.1 recombination endonuclease [Erwinia phage vB_EhrS_49]AXH43589.1 recombination endonuclease [Erwinia phage vB_EhrS_59]